MLILGIESSCDETAAAVVEDGRTIHSSIISSQIPIHKEWGGVVPELASREHLVKIDSVVKEALKTANMGLKEIDAIAVTQGPGLIGSLLVGVSYAKGLALAEKKPIVPVNHIEGHFFSVALGEEKIEYPAMALIVSGGHTNLFFSPKPGKYRVVSRSRDDAAGEAFDKVAKMLGLGYPGGPIVEKIATKGNPHAVKFPIAKISDGKPDFSFSGLKTAVMRYLRLEEIVALEEGEEVTKKIADICASFQYTVVRSLMQVTKKQLQIFQPKSLIIAGGVACNSELRSLGQEIGDELSIPVLFPTKHLSTDNAAMIASAAFFRFSDLATKKLTFSADTSMRLQNLGDEDDVLRKNKVRYRL